MLVIQRNIACEEALSCGVGGWREMMHPKGQTTKTVWCSFTLRAAPAT